jgi:CDP-diglyceride synthetase
VNNETAIISSGTGEIEVSSHAVTLYGIPIGYIIIVTLFILFILYIYCRMTRKERHSMSKSSYLKLFFAFFIPLFFYNLYTIYNSSWFYNVYTKSWCTTFWFTSPIYTIIAASTASLLESIFPYLFITLSILIINCYRKPV